VSADRGTPEGLVEAVAHLVSTGPVPLGAYTLAEIAAVQGVVSFLEAEPPPELLAEAVRSLAARNLITTTAGDDDLEVRGDLGIALAFQERSRLVVDARVTGTEPDRPWRFVLMPQPEDVTLEVLIDALGIHFFSLRTAEQALERLFERLPTGDRGPVEADADAVLARSPQAALVSASHFAGDGARETTDLVLARDGETLHVLLRDPDAPGRLVPQGVDLGEARALVAQMARPDRAESRP
jgi:hypothetical protein